MNIEKKYEISQKRLEDMTEQVNWLKKALGRRNAECRQAQQLIDELKDMYVEWDALLAEMRAQRDEYEILIRQVKALKQGLVESFK